MTHQPDPGQQAFEDGMRWETGVARWRFDGTPVKHAQDPAKALAHYQRSADAQNADGMAALGRLRLWGHGGLARDARAAAAARAAVAPWISARSASPRIFLPRYLARASVTS